MTKRVEDLSIIANHRISADYFVLDLKSSTKLPDIKPGQFVQIRIDNSPDTFLRRPISIYDVDYKTNTLSLLIKSVGKGTRSLSLLERGETVNLVYPLGNTFSLPHKNEKSVLVGGGVGVAPLLLLGKALRENSEEFKFILGYMTEGQIIESNRFSEIAELLVTTEDGSYGYRGFVTEHPELLEGDYDRIYCCGPEPMMKAVAAIAAKRNKICEVSLENMMACGFGVCLCCIVETEKGNTNTCTEGPVFNVNQLKWQT